MHQSPTVYLLLLRTVNMQGTGAGHKPREMLLHGYSVSA